MTDFGNNIRIELGSRELSTPPATLLPGNFASEAELSATSRCELDSLRNESDPELLASGLLHWAGREERAQNFAAAGLAYRFLSDHASNLNLSSEVRQKAQDRLALLSGGGSVGARVEYQLSRFVQEASNPALIAAMATGGVVFSAGRAALLSRLASPGEAILGARFLASAGAFSMEVPAVWATAKGVQELMAPGSQSWSADQNLREIAGLGMTLGALRFCGGAVGRATSLPAGVPAAAESTMAQKALIQGGALAGIVLGRQLEVATGLRAKTDGASVAIDSVAFLLQAQVGGRLAQGSLGPTFQARSRIVESVARQGESLAWSRVLRGQGPDMIGQGQGPDMIRPFFGQGPDMISRGPVANRALFGQGPDMIGQGPDMIHPVFGQGPDMIGQGPDMIHPLFGQGPDMRTALN